MLMKIWIENILLKKSRKIDQFIGKLQIVFILSFGNIVGNETRNDNINKQNYNSSTHQMNYGSNQNDFNMRNNIFNNSKYSSNDKNQQFTMLPFENKVADNLENFVREKLSKFS